MFVDRKERRRVVISGLGVISPIGHGHEEFWTALLKGKNGAAKIASFDTSQFKSNIACEVKNFDFAGHCDAGLKKDFSAIGRASQFGIAATSLAVKDGNFSAAMDLYGRDRIGVVLGTTMGEARILHEIACAVAADGHPGPDVYRNYPVHNLPANVAKYWGFRGPNCIVPTACASGNYAIGLGCDLIRDNRADAMIVGGVDPIDSIVFAGFSRLFSVAPELCQPFDKNRKGLLVGEGAAILIIESLEGALQRSAKIYGEIIGYGLSCDAFHMTNPDPEVNGTHKAVLAAFKDAHLPVEKVDCIIAHGTGTPANDRAEVKLIKKVFKTEANTIPVSANKSMIGHTMGGAAAMNAVTACHILSDGFIPPTINYRTKDPDCDLDCVPNEAREARVSTILSHAFAFGGNNSAMLFKRWKER